MQDIRRTFPATFELATLGIIIGAGIGVPLGVWAAVRRGGVVDQIVRIMGLIGYSIPIFWLGLMALVVFYARLGWVSGPGRIDIVYEYTLTPVTGLLLLDSARAGEWQAFGNVLSHLILPASLLGYFSLAYISRMTRSFMLNELAQEYIVAARAKGLSETRIIWRHALRNAMVPLVTVIALSYAGLLEGSVLTETVFAWPGLGLYLTNSLQNADMNAVLGRHDRRRLDLRRPQPPVRPALHDARSADPRDGAGDDDAREAAARARTRACTTGSCPTGRARGGRRRSGGRTATWRTFARNRLAMVGPPDRARPRAHGGVRRRAEPVLALRRRPAHDAAAAAVGGALVRHRRPGPRHPVAPHLRFAHHVVRRRPRGGARGADRPRGGHDRRLFGRARRRGADADHRHLPRVPAADPRPRVRRGARARHRECGDRHRTHVVASVRADRARRDAHAPAAPTTSRPCS